MIRRGEAIGLAAGVGLGLVALAAVAWIGKKAAEKGAAGIGQAAGGAAVDLIDGAVGGTVERIGGLVGIPATSPDACAAAKAAGDTWEASFACPAGDFLKWFWNK